MNDTIASDYFPITVPLRSVTFLIILFFVVAVLPIFTLITTSFNTATAYPTIKDPNLRAEIVGEGLRFPTSMAFLEDDDILVLEKNNGTVKRIIHGQLQPEPLLDLDVANQGERGMLGIAIARNNNGSINVFLYFTESSTGSDYSGNSTTGDAPRNRLYRYDWLNDSLSNPKLLLDLPAIPGPNHNGGDIAIGPDSNLYLSIGNINDKEAQWLSYYSRKSEGRKTTRWKSWDSKDNTGWKSNFE